MPIDDLFLSGDTSADPAEETITTTVVIAVGDRLIVRPVAKEEKSASGLVVVSNERDHSPRAKVVFTGEKADLFVQEGDTVIYGEYAGTQIEVGDETLLVLRVDDILAILREVEL